MHVVMSAVTMEIVMPIEIPRQALAFPCRIEASITTQAKASAAVLGLILSPWHSFSLQVAEQGARVGERWASKYLSRAWSGEGVVVVVVVLVAVGQQRSRNKTGEQ